MRSSRSLRSSSVALPVICSSWSATRLGAAGAPDAYRTISDATTMRIAQRYRIFGLEAIPERDDREAHRATQVIRRHRLAGAHRARLAGAHQDRVAENGRL